jgi:5'-3' exoribonuclease 1
MNENGDLNLARFEIYLTELAKYDYQRYANENDSFKHLNKFDVSCRTHSKKKSQSSNDHVENDFNFGALEKLLDPMPIDKNDAVNHMSDNRANKSDDTQRRLSVSSRDSDISFHSNAFSDRSHGDEQYHDECPSSTSNTIDALNTVDHFDQIPLIDAEFQQQKNYYYRDKLKIEVTSTDELQIVVEQYIEALQWILKYYYQGCQSWAWFYPHHYAPYLSDLKNFKHMKCNFHRGTPFRPFEQLLGRSMFFSWLSSNGYVRVYCYVSMNSTDLFNCFDTAYHCQCRTRAYFYRARLTY